MASIINDSNGRKIIQFALPNGGAGPKLRLGKMSRKDAAMICGHVEDLLNARITGTSFSEKTAHWLASVGSEFRARLAEVELVPPTVENAHESTRNPATLAEFIDGYTASRIDVKAGTHEIYKQIRRNLVEHFGKDMPLATITAGCAEEFRLALIKQELADATVRRRCGLAKQLFRKAVKKGLIDRNPFEDLVSTSKGNRDRFCFVSRDSIDAVLKACPDVQWRLMIVLSRYGGLRCPSEHLALRWGDVDWEHGRIRVPSPKTEHHDGKAERIVPLFPELLEPLREAFDAAEPGTEFVITKYRSSRTNLRTQFMRIIRKAGLTPWGKPWQNLRSTRQTELAESFPIHVVCAWIGNTPEVAGEHYLQVTDEHFARAANGFGIAVQKTVQPGAVSGSVGSHDAQPVYPQSAFLDEKRPSATECESLELCGTGPQGFEP